MDAEHVVMFSGGIQSWAAAKRVAADHGTNGMVLLFADTNAEEADVYRFRDEAAANVGARLEVVADGRDPWQVFHDDRFLGNSRLANCSKYLKIIPCQQWLAEHGTPGVTTVVAGIDWQELHRIDRMERSYAEQGFAFDAPMTRKPYLTRDRLFAWAREEGLRLPQPYVDGFPHANCASACVRGGQAQWALLWRTHPDRYRQMEANEEALRGELGEVAILRDRSGGESRPMTLREFRERLEAVPDGPSLFDTDEWGGCGCLPEMEAGDGR